MSGFDVFPHQPLSETQRELVLASCGIDPVVDPSDSRRKITYHPDVGEFVRYNATPIFRSSMGGWLRVLSMRTAGVFQEKIEDTSAAEVAGAFNVGALFFGGVLNYASMSQKIPYDEELVARALVEDPYHLAVEGFQTLREEVPSFVELAHEARPALHTDVNDGLHEVALMGAGVLHTFLSGSYDDLRSDDMDMALEEADKTIRN